MPISRVWVVTGWGGRKTQTELYFACMFLDCPGGRGRSAREHRSMQEDIAVSSWLCRSSSPEIGRAAGVIQNGQLG